MMKRLTRRMASLKLSITCRSGRFRSGDMPLNATPAMMLKRTTAGSRLLASEWNTLAGT
jgi:hypothetical protein